MRRGNPGGIGRKSQVASSGVFHGSRKKKKKVKKNTNPENVKWGGSEKTRELLKRSKGVKTPRCETAPEHSRWVTIEWKRKREKKAFTGKHAASRGKRGEGGRKRKRR